MAGRPKSFDVDTALDAFVDVFWTKGYQGTSVDDLQSAVGIKRGSFYAAFGCKDDVFASVLEKYWMEATETGLKLLDQGGAPRPAIAEFIRHVGDFMAQNTPRGCLLLSSASDRSMAATTDTTLICTKMQQLEDRLIKALQRGDPAVAEDDAQSLAAFVLTVILGLNAMARTGCSKDTIQASADYAARSVVYEDLS